MIHLEGPHMGLYDSRSTNRVQMWNTWAVSRSESIGHMVEWVAAVARSAPGGKLRNLVFRCHGDSGYLQMGAGIKLSDIPQFSAWRGLVDRTYFPPVVSLISIQPGRTEELRAAMATGSVPSLREP